MKIPFGNTVAAVKLAALVENKKSFRRTVSTYFGNYMEMLGSIFNMRNASLKRRALLIFRDYYFDAVKRDITLPVDIKTHLLNVMSAYHRNAQRRTFVCKMNSQ